MDLADQQYKKAKEFFAMNSLQYWGFINDVQIVGPSDLRIKAQVPPAHAQHITSTLAPPMPRPGAVRFMCVPPTPECPDERSAHA